ncbi:hypothetical protein BN59_00089 [Legionella massiliensis]|uniref:Uncharacterized protein n=1 Tax=Legionella massiliensis TaxID=1034943 RepID=A0A078KN96_9GAMM|nr:hypothetical protein [Legionella massiliensis]CDZ75830.1 hypothetical protein BN59_00089 [Legionella massiliensis]CEE11568.1 hypothetical protein BN1094_00089 [Legionella massiliensis]
MPFTKLSDVAVRHNDFIPSYKRINGRFERQPTYIYNLRDIQQIRADELEQRLYGNEDFVIAPDESGRNPVKAKIGKLFIEYCPGGKDSFELSIKVIDKHNRTLSSFLNLQNPRYNAIKFENLLPFSLDAFYHGRTMAGNRYHGEVEEQLSHAYELKSIITRLLLGRSISQQHRDLFREHYQALYLANQQPQVQAASSQERQRDISHFGRNLGDKPKSLFEVSAKIGSVALINLSISEQEITDVLVEYLQETKQSPDIFNEVNKKIIIETLLDNKRLPLKSFVADIDTLLNSAIQQLPAKLNASSQQGQAEELLLTESTTAKELDELIQGQLTRPQGLKELKNQYLELLSQQIPTLSAELRYDMALYLLNEPEHFLKKERHFFRTATYSIQTLSMHSVVSTLLQGPDRPSLLDGQAQVDEEHVLSRHAADFF